MFRKVLLGGAVALAWLCPLAVAGAHEHGRCCQPPCRREVCYPDYSRRDCYPPDYCYPRSYGYDDCYGPSYGYDDCYPRDYCRGMASLSAKGGGHGLR